LATDTPLRPADGSSFQPEPGPVRPVPRHDGPATRLRRLIGIDEELLARVPEERTRYTWYGALVANTALVGALSMTLALTSFRSDLPLPAVVAVALVWFWVVLALDSWLVSSTHGTGFRKWTLAPRLALSVLLGLFIAEPILFQIFDKEIRQEVAVANQREVAEYRGMLVSCNPPDGASTTGRPECLPYQLKVAGSPAGLTEQIERNAARTRTLQKEVDAITKTLNDKMATERRECGPSRWIVRNGVRDVTITCERARSDSSSYRKVSKIGTYQKELAALVAKGRALDAKKDRAADAYQPALQRIVDAKTRERAAHLDTDGILTRARALEHVAGSDWFACFITVVLHLLLITFDAMPVLAKAISGATTYDTLLDARFAASRRLHADEIEVWHACARMEQEEQRHRVQQETTDRMRRLEHHYRMGQEERAVRERADLDARVERILRAKRA
jgi:hypothetical protein